MKSLSLPLASADLASRLAAHAARLAATTIRDLAAEDEGRFRRLCKHRRDLTCVDDIVTGIVATLDHTAAGSAGWSGASPNPATSAAPYRLYNIGNNQPVELMCYIEPIERCLGKKAEKIFLPLQVGDVPATWADIDDMARDVGYHPTTPLEVGIEHITQWYLEYHGAR